MRSGPRALGREGRTAGSDTIPSTGEGTAEASAMAADRARWQGTDFRLSLTIPGTWSIVASATVPHRDERGNAVWPATAEAAAAPATVRGERRVRTSHWRKPG